MSTPAKRLEPFAVPGGLRGTLARLSLPELLRELQERAATGIVALTSGGARKALYLKAGRVVFASSNLPTDRLGEVLLRSGKITREQNEASVRRLRARTTPGPRARRVGALSPQELWSAVQAQVSEIVFSVFQWDEGQFHFEESVLPEKERITVDLDVTALVLEGLRRADPASAMRGRELDALPGARARSDAPPRACCSPGRRTCSRSWTARRASSSCARRARPARARRRRCSTPSWPPASCARAGRKVRALDQDFVPEDTEMALVDSFNKMYRRVLAYMVREVGPIAESVLAKYLGTVRQARPEILQDVAPRSDGALEESALERNLARLAEDKRRAALVDALNELLYAELLAVKRTLGPDHETALVRELRPPR